LIHSAYYNLVQYFKLARISDFFSTLQPFSRLITAISHNLEIIQIAGCSRQSTGTLPEKNILDSALPAFQPIAVNFRGFQLMPVK